MRRIGLIVVHCSATRADRDFTEHDVERCHRRRGFDGAGYHFYVRKNGDVKPMRPLHLPGAHAAGHNRHSIGVCYEGGLDARYRPADTRTPRQKHSLRALVRALCREFPGCRVCGHRELSPDADGDGRLSPGEWVKECPCFDAGKEYEDAGAIGNKTKQ